MNIKVDLYNKMMIKAEAYFLNVVEFYPNNPKMLKESQQVIWRLVNRVDNDPKMTEIQQIDLDLVDEEYFKLMEFYHPEVRMSKQVVLNRLIPYLKFIGLGK